MSIRRRTFLAGGLSLLAGCALRRPEIIYTYAEDFTVLVPTSLDDTDLEKFLGGVFNGLTNYPIGRADLICFGNVAMPIEDETTGEFTYGEPDPIVEGKVMSNIDRSMAKVSELFQTYKPITAHGKFELRSKIVDYRDFEGARGIEFAQEIMGRPSGKEGILTLGHGRTKETGFQTFRKFQGGGTEARLFSWNEYFLHDRWIDMSCGSTFAGDPYSRNEGSPYQQDGRVRFFADFPEFLANGFDIKQAMKREFIGVAQ